MIKNKIKCMYVLFLNVKINSIHISGITYIPIRFHHFYVVKHNIITFNITKQSQQTCEFSGIIFYKSRKLIANKNKSFNLFRLHICKIVSEESKSFKVSFHTFRFFFYVILPLLPTKIIIIKLLPEKNLD